MLRTKAGMEKTLLRNKLPLPNSHLFHENPLKVIHVTFSFETQRKMMDSVQ